MADPNSRLIFAPDTEFSGQIRGGERVTILGRVEGSLATRHVVIGPGGSFKGSLRVESAEIAGKIRGDISVRGLMSVAETGDVEGDVRYGQLVLEKGGNLVANLSNVPPELGGDFELEVVRGGQVIITAQDLNATDADDGAHALTFTAANLLNGHLAHRDAPSEPLASFTQADINAGAIMFVHNGSGTANAGFDVVVADDDGATAGPLRPVMVRVDQTGFSEARA